MRKLEAALTGYLLLSVFLASFASAANFTDVPENYWARKEIEYVTERGLFLGRTSTTFAPSGGMTRGQMAAVLYRLAGLPEARSAMVYTDVPEHMYYYDAIRWAWEKSVFSREKSGSDTLSPDETITRGEFAVMLRNYDLARGGKVESLTEATAFTDMDGASAEVRDAILGWACPKGILRGTTESTMNPNGRLTRAHVAVMLARYDQSIGNIAGAYSLQELAGGQLKENTTYALLVGEEFTEDTLAISSSDPEVVEVRYGYYAWVLLAKKSGTATLTATDKATGLRQTLRVTVSATGEAPARPDEDTGALTAYREQREEIARLANEVRVRSGAREAAISEMLMNAAQALAETLPMDHDSMLEFECRQRYGCNHGVGCNLFRTSGHNPDNLPKLAVSAWENSRGHYLAMVNGSADSMGIGVYYDKNTEMFFCVMFAGDCALEGELFGNPHN